MKIVFLTLALLFTVNSYAGIAKGTYECVAGGEIITIEYTDESFVFDGEVYDFTGSNWVSLDSDTKYRIIELTNRVIFSIENVLIASNEIYSLASWSLMNDRYGSVSLLLSYISTEEENGVLVERAGSDVTSTCTKK